MEKRFLVLVLFVVFVVGEWEKDGSTTQITEGDVEKDPLEKHRKYVQQKILSFSRLDSKRRQEGDPEEQDPEEEIEDPPIDPGEVAGYYLHPNRYIYVYWVYNGTMVDFFVAAPSTSWMGIGFSTKESMLSADIVVGGLYSFSEEQEDHFDVDTGFYYAVVADRHSTKNHEMPVLDEQQDIHLQSGFFIDNWEIIEFSRLVDTKDEIGDIPLNEATYLLWATGPPDDSLKEGGYSDFHQHNSRRGAAEVDFSKGFADHIDDVMKEEAHGTMMMFSFGMFAVLAAVCARYMKVPFGKHWLKIHVALVFGAAVLALLAFVTIFISVSEKNHSHFDNPHKVFGLLLIIGLFAQIGLGIASNVTHDPSSEVPSYFPEKSHWWFGRFIILGGFLNMISGFLIFEKTGYAPWVLLVVWGLASIAYLVMFELNYRGDLPTRSTLEKEYELVERGVLEVKQNNNGLFFCFASLAAISVLLVVAMGFLMEL